jgi:hypothetical protein
MKPIDEGDVWVMNNWQDIESCFGVPPQPLSTRCGGQGVTIFFGMAQAGAGPADRAGAWLLSISRPERAEPEKVERAMPE